MTGWENFFIGELGASAALTGLVLVSISINLTKIVQHDRLPNLALEALLSLIIVIFLSTLMLIPTQSFVARAIECICIGTIGCIIIGRLQLASLQKVPHEFRFSFIRNSLYVQFAALCCIIAGIIFYFFGADGFYWLVATTILAYIASLSDVWILTIEINR